MKLVYALSTLAGFTPFVYVPLSLTKMDNLIYYNNESLELAAFQEYIASYTSGFVYTVNSMQPYTCNHKHTTALALISACMFAAKAFRPNCKL